MDAAAIGRKLKQLYPQYQTVDDAVLGQKYMQKYGGAVSSVQSGQIGIKDIPEAQRVGVSVGLDAVGYKQPTKETAAQVKKDESLNAVTNLIQNLEKHYQQAGGGEVNVPVLSRIIGKKKDIEGALGFNDSASTYNKEKEGFAATLKSLTGDTGVLTDQDFARLSKLLPALGAKPQEAKNLLNDLRSQVSAKYGGKATKTTIKPDEKGAFEALLPSTAGYLEGRGQEQEKLRKLAESNPELAGQQANEQAQALLQNKAPLNFIMNLVKGQKEAGALAAPTSEIVGDVAMLQGGKALLSGGKNLLKGKFTSQAALGEARKQAAKDLTANTKSLVQAGDDYVAKIDPGAKKAWETLKPAIKETTSIDDLLEKLSNWGSKAYTKSGDKRAITEGLLKEHLYRSGRDVIKKEAPEVAKITAQMGKRKGLEDLLKKTAVPAAVGAGASAPIGLLLYKLLGQKRQ